ERRPAPAARFLPWRAAAPVLVRRPAEELLPPGKVQCEPLPSPLLPRPGDWAAGRATPVLAHSASGRKREPAHWPSPGQRIAPCCAGKEIRSRPGVVVSVVLNPYAT